MSWSVGCNGWLERSLRAGIVRLVAAVAEHNAPPKPRLSPPSSACHHAICQPFVVHRRSVFQSSQYPVFSGFQARIGAGLVLVCRDESTGKTTLLRLLAGELTPQQGLLTLHGISAGPSREAYRPGVPCRPTFRGPRPTDRTGLAGRPGRGYPGWDAEALALHIQGFALAEHLDKTFYALSTGTRRKVCMAATLASQARLTLIDEPIAGLDKPSVVYLAQALGRSCQGAERAVMLAHYAPLPGVRWTQVLELPPRE